MALNSMDSEPISHSTDQIPIHGMDVHSTAPATHLPTTVLPFSPVTSATPSLASPSSTFNSIGSSPLCVTREVTDWRSFEALESRATKPSIATLIRAALLASPDCKATLDQISALISNNYKEAGRFKRLKGDVRHRLSRLPRFQIRDRPDWKVGKGQYWTYVEELDNSLKSKSGSSRSRRGPASAHHPKKAHTKVDQDSPTSLHPSELSISYSPVASVEMPLSPLLSPPSIFENDHLLINSRPTSPIPPISPNLTSAPIAPYEGPPEWTTAAATTLPTMTGMIGHSAQSGLGGDFSQIQYLLQDLRSASSPMPGIVMPLAMPDLAAATVAPKMQEQQPTDDSGMTALMYQIFNPSFL